MQTFELPFLCLNSYYFGPIQSHPFSLPLCLFVILYIFQLSSSFALLQIDDDLPLEYLSEMRQVSVVFINLIFASGADIDESDSLQEAFNIIYDSMLAFEGIVW